MTGRRNPRPLSDSLAAVLDRVAPSTPLARAQLAWPRAAGGAIAAESEAVAEREGVVTIACSSATWAQQLDLLQAELLERLRAEIGPGCTVKSLRFRVGERGGGHGAA